MDANGIIEKTGNYVTTLLKEKLTPDHTYHDLEHTLMVKAVAEQLADELKVPDDEREALSLAALLHDVGYVDAYDGHEAVSKQMAKDFLQEQGYPEEKIELVSKLIEATRMEHQPGTELESILKDADLVNLAHPNYEEHLANLRHEWAVFRGEEYNELAWLEENIQFLKKHRYFTGVARDKFQSSKKANEKTLKKKLKQMAKAVKKVDSSSLLAGNRSAQMMFKTTLRNHIDLTNIADNKANIMLSINALIITITMPLLASNAQENPFLLFPTSILLTTCVISIIFATLATRPIRTKGFTRLEDLRQGKTNLFFFGNFYKMNLADYKSGIRQVVSDEEILDDTIITDLFFLGKALGTKFYQLRICYSVFMVGVTITVISFAVAFLFKG